MQKDKRRSPRVKVRVPVRLATEGGTVPVDASTLDLSYDGAYCRAARFIPLNSKVDVQLELPGSEVLCKGIVVRNKKGAGKDQYGIALFLSDISGAGRQNIAEFIDEKLREAGIETRSSSKKVRDFVSETSYVSRRGDLEISSAKFRVLEGEMVISSKGLLCRTNKKVPLFKEIAVNIVLPSTRPGGREAIQCSGVVVNCEKLGGKNRYDLTIYFTDLSSRERMMIDAFVESGKKAASPGGK